jgi:hypothetical protein
MGALKFNPKNKNEKQKRQRRRRKSQKKKGYHEKEHRVCKSASLQAIPSRAAEIPIPKGPHSPLKLCIFIT